MAEPQPALPWLQSQYQTAGQLINDVAVEVGLSASGAPLASQDPNFVQLKVLANLGGRDLVKQHPWQLFQRSYTFVTVSSGPPPPTGLTTYPLPLDYLEGIDQTAWNRTARLPMAGPLLPQGWEWLVGLVSNQFTIYLGFRIWGGVFAVYPSPNPANQTIAYEYQSKNWIQPVGTSDIADRNYLIQNPADLIIFEPNMFTRMLKLRFLDAKGFDTGTAMADFDNAFSSVTGPDSQSPKLNLANTGWGMRYLDALNNVPPSGFGMP